jgi:hypothetical protein
MSDPGLSTAHLHTLVAAAGAAPSLHDSQPWRFEATADGGTVWVRTDPCRAVAPIDPDGRALHVSVGAALLNLRVAARHFGHEPVVRLLPFAGDPQIAAEVDLRSPYAGPERLYPAIAERHSSRVPFEDRPVPPALPAEFVAAAAAEGARLVPLAPAEAHRVLELTAEAERRTAADLDRASETRRWLRPERPAVDGIPTYALGPQDHTARVPMRAYSGHPPVAAPPSRVFEALPQVCTLSTVADRPADWLRAGQALERVWLLATLHGLRATVLHQAVEWPDTRWGLRDPAGGPGCVQLLLRLGFGPPGPATPRRPVAEILTVTEGAR